MERIKPLLIYFLIKKEEEKKKMIEPMMVGFALIGLVLLIPAYAYILLALKAHMSDQNTKNVLTNTMLAQHNTNMLRGESNEIVEAKAEIKKAE